MTIFVGFVSSRAIWCEIRINDIVVALSARRLGCLGDLLLKWVLTRAVLAHRRAHTRINRLIDHHALCVDHLVGLLTAEHWVSPKRHLCVHIVIVSSRHVLVLHRRLIVVWRIYMTYPSFDSLLIVVSILDSFLPCHADLRVVATSRSVWLECESRLIFAVRNHILKRPTAGWLKFTLLHCLIWIRTTTSDERGVAAPLHSCHFESILGSADLWRTLRYYRLTALGFKSLNQSEDMIESNQDIAWNLLTFAMLS